MHEFDAGKGLLRRLKGLETEHRPSQPLHGSMVLFHHMIEIFHLTDDDRGAVLGMKAPNGGSIRLTAVDGDRLRHAMAANGLREKPRGRALVSG